MAMAAKKTANTNFDCAIIKAKNAECTSAYRKNVVHGRFRLRSLCVLQASA